MTRREKDGGTTIMPPNEMVDADVAGRQRVAGQWARMPIGWRGVDRGIVQATEWILFATGVLFTIMITLEVISRYVFSFSISFVNAAARLLLVWFFLLGAGIAMRHGAHVGFELLLSAMSPRRRRLTVLLGLSLCVAFCLEMIWAGFHSLGPAAAQTEPGLGISLIWPILAIPVGFALLCYHTLIIIWVEARSGRNEGSRS